MIRTLLSLLRSGSGRTVAAHLALTVLGLVLRAVGAVLLVPLVAALFGPAPGEAWVWLGLLVLVTAAGWVVDTCAARLAFALGFGLLETGQRTVVDRISAIRLGWFTAEHTAVARQAVAATGPDLVGIVIYLVSPLIGAVLLPALIGIALLFVSWPLGVAALIGVPVLLGAFWVAGRLGRSADHAAAEANTMLTERIVEFARTQQALRAARRVDPARSHAGAALAAQHGATVKLLLLQIPGQLIFGLATQLALLLLAGTTVVLTVGGELSVPQAIALIVVIVRYLEPFTVLAELSPGVESTTGALRRIREVLDAPSDVAGAPAYGARGDADGSPAESPAAEAHGAATAPQIELRGVGFAYQGDTAGEAVLTGFNLSFEPGTTTAIVGPSGSGKSTILALLAGLHQPTAGSIVIDGIDVATLSPAARRELVSVVFQHPYLFDGDIRQNVLASRPEADEASLASVASLAKIDTLLERLPDGWGTRVGEAGTALSGGERQRVSIARALLKQAPVLLVDEATSALDNENEAAVAAALSHDPAPRTCVIVAHRLSSIRAADRVIFLEQGRIVEDGTIEQLLAAGGRFAEFWNQQGAASGWRISAGSAPVQSR